MKNYPLDLNENVKNYTLKIIGYTPLTAKSERFDVR
jgi:hypothetical protein